MAKGGGRQQDTEIGEGGVSTPEEWTMAGAPSDSADAFETGETPARKITLVYRIGLGEFGETWLVRLRMNGNGLEDSIEAVLKILPRREDTAGNRPSLRFVERVNRLVQALRFCSSSDVCYPQSYTILDDGRIGILTPIYKRSILDIMISKPGERLQMQEVLRFGAQICRSIRILHEKEVLSLNLRPSNVLVDEQGNAVVGAFGIPWLLAENFCLDHHSTVEGYSLRVMQWLGTPNYMAPEQWAPAIRGPLREESDVWGFACTAIEMMTGRQPWAGLKPSEIFEAVVVKKERPQLPPDLPFALRSVLASCFTYDPSERPSFHMLERTFLRPRQLCYEGDWAFVKVPPNGPPRMGVVAAVPNCAAVEVQICDRRAGDTITCKQSAVLGLVKDPFTVGDTVRLKQKADSGKGHTVPPRFGWCGYSPQVEAQVKEVSKSSALLGLSFTADSSSPTPSAYHRADPTKVEKSTSGFGCGDWVKFSGWAQLEPGDNMARPASIGIVRQVNRDGTIGVAFFGCETLQKLYPPNLDPRHERVERVEGFTVGQRVRLKGNIVKPKFQWPDEKKGGGLRNWLTGKVESIAANGLLTVRFSGPFGRYKSRCMADPEEVEVVKVGYGLSRKLKDLKEEHFNVGSLLKLGVFLLALRLGHVLVHSKKRIGSEESANVPSDSSNSEPSAAAPSSNLEEASLGADNNGSPSVEAKAKKLLNTLLRPLQD